MTAAKSILAIAATLALGAGCGKPVAREPDGSCGVTGVCLLPAVQGEAARGRWADLRITLREVNNPAADPNRTTQRKSDERGEFKIALDPGQYAIGVFDPARLDGKTLDPVRATVRPGAFTEVVIDYDLLNVRD